jgi:hypothetical protein
MCRASATSACLAVHATHARAVVAAEAAAATATAMTKTARWAHMLTPEKAAWAWLTPAQTAQLESRETPVVTLATTVKAAIVAHVAWTSTSVVETPAAAMATAAKTAVWVWRPAPGPLRKSRGALMALLKLLPQLRPLGF